MHDYHREPGGLIYSKIGWANNGPGGDCCHPGALEAPFCAVWIPPREETRATIHMPKKYRNTRLPDPWKERADEGQFNGLYPR
jgi:hypothetical protein